VIEDLLDAVIEADRDPRIEPDAVAT